MTIETAYGTLYLCATPIGNLEDMTPRAIRMLSEADIIAAEDTRHTRQLLNHFEIKGHLLLDQDQGSYYSAVGLLFGLLYKLKPEKDRSGYSPEDVQKLAADFSVTPITDLDLEQISTLLQELQDGKNVALVSDAGFPGIADPGEALAKEAIAAGIKVVPVPGANAALCALIASGLPAYPFFFGGFLPKSKRNRREQLTKWQYIPATVILYEAPHRLEEVLQDILACWGDRQMAAARELTKLHEEFFRGTVSECLAWIKVQPPRGEFCLVLAPGAEPVQEEADVDPLTEVKQLIAGGMDKKEALAKVAKARRVPKRELYNSLLQEE